MTKIKEKLYEHRFGLFFFVFLLAYSFFVSNNMRLWKITDLTVGFHAVDFSVGFCTRILPGAIYNLFFDGAGTETLSVYVISILLFCLFAICILLEKLVLKADGEKRAAIVLFVMLFLTGSSTFSVYRIIFAWLDLYWLLAAVLFFIALSKKQLYVLIVPISIFVIMVHYASIVCFIPFFVLCMMYKLMKLEDKKEKRLLTVVMVISIISSVLLFAYMALFEIDNLNYTIEEFNEILISKGVKDLEYYDYTFYRQSLDRTFEDLYGGATENKITEINSENSVLAFIQIVIQNIQTNAQMATLKDDIVDLFILSPVVLFIFSFFISASKEEKGLRKLVPIFSILLFFVTLVVGNLFSTDTERWICHSYMPLMASFFYVIYIDADKENKVKQFLSRIPEYAVVIYFFIYAITI